jgi:hypothetical protein
MRTTTRPSVCQWLLDATLATLARSLASSTLA